MDGSEVWGGQGVEEDSMFKYGCDAASRGRQTHLCFLPSRDTSIVYYHTPDVGYTMSLSELFSFAVSGSAATAVSALVTDRVSPEERRGRPRQRDTDSSPRPIATRSAANGLIFFFTYYVAATAQFGAGASDRGTRRAATDAFLVGATASVFTRLFGPSAGPEAPAGYRWSLPALEDDAVLAIDPGLTFCVHEVLARGVAGILSKRQQQQPQSRIYGSAVVATLTTFLLAATSKAVATGLTYPLYAAAAEATERRWATRAEEEEADVPLIILEDEEDTGGWARRPHYARNRAPGKRQHNVLTVLLQMLRAGGVRSVYVDWLRAVAAAALKHGLTMALQRSIYGYILRFVLSLTSYRRTRATAAATTTTTTRAAPTASPAAITSPTTFTKPETAAPAHAPLPIMPRQPEPHPHPVDTSSPEPLLGEARTKVNTAVESWLDSSSVASKGTVDVDDSVSNISSRPRRPAATLQAQRRETVVARYGVSQRPREVAGLATSRASEPTAFYPDAAAAGRRQVSGDKGNHDFDDDDGSLIFNMVSKSPRVIKGRREGA
ncbi:hypothetical protein F503_07230 [Ophiostoma piceae UAMH 11346]|uniref:Uncharacterized protein n=1 Tax=Ophiostoma piceae (strain UAMH 11346) TaxID=1262450 RepID=S3C7C7_OPHP1|nr:hypothetical protein F503_07230 [Ophiostoma piceae UAMH 11346]